MAAAMAPDYERQHEGELWVCYCGAVAPWGWSFPHWDCQGGRPVLPHETDLIARGEPGPED